MRLVGTENEAGTNALVQINEKNRKKMRENFTNGDDI
jgi:hypothetical protein